MVLRLFVKGYDGDGTTVPRFRRAVFEIVGDFGVGFG